MVFKIKSRIVVDWGILNYEHKQTFADNSNVFGRVLEYRQFMQKQFPNCDFELVSAEEV